MRYWIGSEDEDYDRELQRAQAAGEPLPTDLSCVARLWIGAMIAIQVIAAAALALLVWIR
jgi:hypothetical protein